MPKDQYSEIIESLTFMEACVRFATLCREKDKEILILREAVDRLEKSHIDGMPKNWYEGEETP